MPFPNALSLTKLTLASVVFLALSNFVPPAMAESPDPRTKFRPRPVVGEPVYSNGCWARLYDGHNFQGRNLEIVGNNSLEDLKLPSGLDWRDETDSLEVGSGANLEAYSKEHFKGEKEVIGPSIRLNRVETEINPGRLRSVKLVCLK